MRAVAIAAVVVLALTTTACESRPRSTATGGASTKRAPATPPGESDSNASPTGSRRLLVLGPEGVGPLRLGMTLREIEATDAASVSLAGSAVGDSEEGWRPGCGPITYDTNFLGGTPGDLNGIMSARNGIEKLNATSRMVTPQGIRLGSSLDEVRTALHRPEVIDGDSVVVEASHDAVYRIQLNDVVTEISLQRRRVTCQI